MDPPPPRSVTRTDPRIMDPSCSVTRMDPPPLVDDDTSTQSWMHATRQPLAETATRSTTARTETAIDLSALVDTADPSTPVDMADPSTPVVDTADPSTPVDMADMESTRRSHPRDVTPVTVAALSTAEQQHPELNFHHKDVGQLVELQQTLLDDQDEQLDDLSEVIARHREMGQQIATELHSQADMLDSLDHAVDTTDHRALLARQRLQRAADQAKRRDQRWVGVMCVLIVVLIVVIAVKGR